MSDVAGELAALCAEHGQLTPAMVVEAARPADAPLHDRFEWDDARAGERYRLDQARALIRSVRIVYRSEPAAERRSVRGFVSIDAPTGRAYRHVDEVAADPVLSAIVAADMRREWRAFRTRYGHTAEFLALVRAELEARPTPDVAAG